MKTVIATLIITFAVGVVLFAKGPEGKKTKKVQQFKVEKVVDLPAQEVWHVVAEDYGAIANSHPKIIKSDYINGALEGKEGAQRICYFNEKGTQFLQEQMTNLDAENMTFTNKVFQAGKFPVDPDYTKAIYRVEDLGNGKSRISFDMTFRTKPAMMGSMAKGKFKKLIEDYFIAIEHHVRTGESVTQENFKKIKKQYES